MTRFSNSAGNGYVDADGFKGAPSAADVNAQRASTQPAQFPNGAVLAAGTTLTAPNQQVAAAGSNSQSGSTVVLPGEVMIVTCSGSTRGIRLSVKTTSSRYEVFNSTAFNALIYPATNALINALSTNGAYKLSAHKGAIFNYRSGTLVASVIGA